VLLLIVAIVQIPAIALALLAGSSTSTTGSSNNIDAYTNFAAIFMDAALLYAAFSWHKDNNSVGLKRAYYDSSKYVLKFLLASALVILGLLPALFGLIIYAVAAAAGSGIGSTIGEQAIIIALCLLVAAPSFWFLTRYLLGPVAVVAGDLDPLKSLARSRRLSLGRFWRVLARLLILCLVVIVVALVVLAPGFILTLLVPSAGGWASVYFELAFALVVLPYISIYLVNLYQDLAKTTDQ
jgi:hypothetical protein